MNLDFGLIWELGGFEKLFFVVYLGIKSRTRWLPLVWVVMVGVGIRFHMDMLDMPGVFGMICSHLLLFMTESDWHF